MNGQILNGVAPDVSTADVLNAMVEGVYITDTDRKILFWNRAAEAITGWTAAEVVGKCCRFDVLCHVDKEGRAMCGKEVCPLHRCMISGKPNERPVLLYAHTNRGNRVPVEVTVAPLRDTSGTIIGGMQIFRDVSHEEENLLRALLIQRSMLLSEVNDPRVAVETRITSQEIVGGDSYRVELCGKDGLAIMLSDATGRGVAAALHSLVLHSLWMEQRANWHDPAAALTEINHRLIPMAVDAGYFATAVAAYIDLSSGAIRMVCAGHPAPFLFYDNSAQACGRSQFALGMVDTASFTNDEFSWRAGDTLLFFTDGAIRICDYLGRELTAEGLRDAARAIRDAHQGDVPLHLLEQRIHQFGGVHQQDDMTLMKVRRLE